MLIWNTILQITANNTEGICTLLITQKATSHKMFVFCKHIKGKSCFCWQFIAANLNTETHTQERNLTPVLRICFLVLIWSQSCPDKKDKLHMSGYTGQTVHNCPDVQDKLSTTVRIYRTNCPQLSGCRARSFRICLPLTNAASKRVEAEVFAVINMKASVFRGVPPCGLSVTYRRFGYICTLQLYNRIKKSIWTESATLTIF
jgi:hypothetical protein